MKNLDKRESLSTHAFGCGLKYLEQWFSGPLYTAIMVLLTDLSSLGHGSGDFDLDKAPTFLKQFITPMIGRWAGDRVIFSGDYTEALTLNHGCVHVRDTLKHLPISQPYVTVFMYGMDFNL